MEPGDRKRKPLECQAVFDIETSNWDTFVLGAILWADGTYREYSWRGEGQLRMAEDLLLTPGTLWAHNGGLFDAKWLADRCLELECPFDMVRSGSRIVRLKAGACEVLDSFALAKVSLADLSADLSEKKIATGLKCRPKSRGGCGEDCGGYCAIKRRMPDREWRLLRRYLRRDCEALMASLKRLEEWAAAPSVDLDLSATVGASAWRSARRTLELPDAELTWGQHRFARKAYFGGRVEVFRPRSDAGHEYDVCQMYPWALRSIRVPWGPARNVWLGKASKALDRAIAGKGAAIVKATVVVPECHLPPLPLRRHDRIWYPTGRFVGVWTSIELARAIECGVQVEPTQALVWDETEKPFAPWIDKLHELREGAPGGKKGPLGTFCKFLANSLTGKFGAKPVGQRIVTRPEDMLTCECEGRGQPGFSCDGSCGAFVPLDKAGQICAVTRWHLSPECHVAWSAHITSAARVEWHRMALSKAGGWDCVYCDTDSLFCERERTRRIGSLLGQWEWKGAYEAFECEAPKLYRYRRAERWNVKAKGLELPKVRASDPLRGDRLDDTWAAITSGVAMPSRGIWGLSKGAASGQFFKRRPESDGRQVSQGWGDRVLEPGASVTRARSFAEIVREVG